MIEFESYKSRIYEKKEDRNEVIEYFVSALNDQQRDLSRTPGQNVFIDQEADERSISLENLTSEILLAILNMGNDEVPKLKRALQTFIQESGRAIDTKVVSALTDVFTALGAKEVELQDRIEVGGRVLTHADLNELRNEGMLPNRFLCNNLRKDIKDQAIKIQGHVIINKILKKSRHT